MKLKDEKTEVKILEAAKEVFTKHGLYGARMQEIADLAGINKALLHYYFRNKEKLFDAVFEGALKKYFEQMMVIGDTSLPVKERLFVFVDNMFKFLEEYPMMAIFILKEVTIHPEVFREKIKQMKTNQPFLIHVLKDAMDKKEIKSFDPFVFMINLQSLCAYPFIAGPIYKNMFTANGYDWGNTHDNIEKIKDSVKEFITFKFQ
jgi:TetR/AcrR family transcriptional regulator